LGLNSNVTNVFKSTNIGSIPVEWNIVHLIDALDLLTDGSHFSPKEKKKGSYYMASVKDMTEHKINLNSCKRIEKDAFERLTKANCKPKRGDVLFSKDGTMGICFVFNQSEPIVVLSSIAILRPSKEFNSYFLKYYLSNNRILNLIISGHSSGSALPRLTLTNLKDIPVVKPSIKEQHAVAKILSDLDSKIELNNQMNKTLESIAQAIFKRWFIDFEFPNENGEPYKSSGGEMVESELGMIPKGWCLKRIGEIIINHDSNRIPLSRRERDDRHGIYPYYGATGVIDYIDDYIFNGIYLLLAEDGSVVNTDDTPVLQYVDGKFWCNNHAHVLTGRDNFSTEFIYCLLRTTNVKGLVTGAVQLKINQSNLNELKVIAPPKELLEDFQNIVKNLFATLRLKRIENSELGTIRDLLLPKLMTGKIRVPLED